MTSFTLPKDLNLEEVVSLNPPTFKLKIDVLKYIISIIVGHQKFTNDNEFSDFVPISSEILRALTYDYKEHINYLIDYGIIEALVGPSGKETYQAGSSCKRYRLVKAYSDFTLEPITNSNILKKVKPSLPAPEYLVKWFGPNLTIDENDAIAIMDSDEGKKPLSDLLAIRRIQHRDFEMSRDRWGYRTYSNLVGLRSPYRRCLRYEDKRMVALDLKSSQPWLIANTILNPKFYQTSEEVLEKRWDGKFNYRLTPNPKDFVPEATSSPYAYTLPIPHITVSPSLIFPVSLAILQHNRGITLENFIGQYLRLFRDLSHCSRYSLYYVSDFSQQVKEYLTKPDVGQFREIVQNCDVYEALRQRVPSIKDREEAKERFWAIFYGRLESKPKGKKAMMAEFPSVFAILDLIKAYSKHLPWYRKDKPHAALAVLLQFIESAIFIDSISKRLSIQHPDVPIFTIHDSILTVQGEEDKVEAVMADSLSKLVGAKPTIKRTYY